MTLNYEKDKKLYNTKKKTKTRTKMEKLKI